MECSTSVSMTTCLLRRLSAAGTIPPAAVGLLPDLALETGTPMAPADLSVDFTGPLLSFALAPGSDPLPDGLSLSVEGVLTGTPVAETASRSIIVRATNPDGVADSGFFLTVADMLLDFTATLTGLTNNPTFGPSALSGATLSAVADGFSGPTPGTIAYQWKTVESGVISGATAAAFAPNAALIDGETLFCTITPDGYPPKDTLGAVVRLAPPTASGNPGEQFWDIDTGLQAIDMSTYVSGTGLLWSVAGQGAAINAATGALTIRTESSAIGAMAAVTAQNSGGAVTIAFTFSVEDPDAGPGPDLSIPILDDITDEIAFSIDAAATIYWRRDPVGTNADPNDVIGGGGFDSGSFAVQAGQTVIDLTFAPGNDGAQEISFVGAVTVDEPSLVRTAAIEIDTVAPALATSVPAAGASNVASDTAPVLTFSEPISPGLGTVSLYDVTAGSALETFDVVLDAGTGPGTVQIAGSSLTLRPSTLLSAGRQYAVLLDAGAVRDSAGNDHAGITETATLSFSTDTSTVIDTHFGAEFTTIESALWASMQANGYNTTPEHRPTEPWAAYPASVTDGGIVGLKTGNYPQLRFSVPVEVGRTYTIDADLPIGEDTWAGPLRVKVGSAINLNDYSQIDEPQAGQPRVVELRGLSITASTTELWFAIIIETNGGGVNGGYPALSMLRVRES